ncbi:MAG: LacI family DNA-binding transcriptional regulator [Acidimicrobiales bacterium]
MSKRPISIATVAAEAGVGVGTVSRVLNGSDQVSEATRKRVLGTMERLDYRPLRSASSLSKGRTDAVGILVSVITRPSVMARLVGVIDVLSDAGLDAVVFNVENRAQLDRHLSSIIDQRRVDGIISISLTIPKERLTRIRKLAIPLVLVDNSLPHLSCVYIDDVAGGRLATEHLLSLGHRRIGFVGDNAHTDLGMTSSEDRYAGYLMALDASGIEPDFDLVARGPHSSEAAAVLTSALFELGKHRPTAIFASSDTLAVGAVKATQQHGLTLPDDCAVIGFDNLEISSILDISTVNQPLLESGIKGASKMVSLLNGEIAKPHREELPLEVVPRGSSLGNQRNSYPKPYGVVEGPNGLQILQGGEELVS